VALALPLKVALNVPIIFDYQGSLTAEMLTHGFLSSRSPLRPFWSFLETFLDRRADLILSSTSHALEDIRRRAGVPEERLLLLPDSVDPTRFRPPTPADEPRLAALRARWRIDPARPVVAYLGLLAPYQGVDMLLHAFRRLIAEHLTPVRPLLMLMGYPFVARYRQLVARLGLSDDVRVTGPVLYDDAPDYLRLAQVAVAPKRPVSEGAGKLLPYMATALPVIATDTPAHRAYLGDEGYYAPSDDVEAFSRALARGLTDPDAPTRGRRLRQRVLASYTWERAGERIEAGYARVLERRMDARG